ncbi:PaaI family thioesterase [Paenibacillus gansuensis]|uniref:PaaI family thioesterase n=1 Tax=Paenibacillus gansuensis TaxID=306542 RepID=A0ABW5PBE9_9BACL
MNRPPLQDRIAALSERGTGIVEKTVHALEQMKENKYPFLGNFLQIVYEPSDDPETFVCSMPITPDIQNPYRIVYGGVTATLADMAMAWMLEHQLEPGIKFVTVDMNIQYHHAGTGRRLLAEARLVSRARDILQVSCRISNDKGSLVAASTATFMQLT